MGDVVFKKNSGVTISGGIARKENRQKSMDGEFYDKNAKGKDSKEESENKV